MLLLLHPSTLFQKSSFLERMFLRLQEVYQAQQMGIDFIRKISRQLVLIYVEVVAGVATYFLPKLVTWLSVKLSRQMKQQVSLSQKHLLALSRVMMECAMVHEVEVYVLGIGMKALPLVVHLPVLLICLHRQNNRAIRALVVV